MPAIGGASLGVSNRVGGISAGGSRKAFNYNDIMDQFRKQQEKANAANEQRYQEILGRLADTRGQVGGTYGHAEDLLADLGASEGERIERQRMRETGRSEQDLISRGLGNTTVRETTRRGIEEDAGRASRDLSERVGAQKAGLLLSRAGAEERQGNFLADMMERRSDVGPDLGMMAGLLQQYGAGVGSAAGDTGGSNVFAGMSSNARAGLDAFGQPMGTPGSSGGRPNMIPGSPGTAASTTSRSGGGGGGGGGGSNAARHIPARGGGGSQYRQASETGAQAYGQQAGGGGGAPQTGGGFAFGYQNAPEDAPQTFGPQGGDFKPTSFDDLFSPDFQSGDITDLFGDAGGAGGNPCPAGMQPGGPQGCWYGPGMFA